METLSVYLALMRQRAATWERQSPHHWAQPKMRMGLPRRRERVGGFGVRDSSRTMAGAGAQTRVSWLRRL